MKSKSECPECRGNPQGVLLLNRYVPCGTCGTAEEDDLVRGSMPGKRAGNFVRSRYVGTTSLHNRPDDEAVGVMRYQYVYPRAIEDGTIVWVFCQRKWDVVGKSKSSSTKTEWWVAHRSQQGAENAFDAWGNEGEAARIREGMEKLREPARN